MPVTAEIAKPAHAAPTARPIMNNSPGSMALMIRERMPMGLVGWEWMRDHCHLNHGALAVFMEDLARELFPMCAGGERR